jgi:hypothetical protein
MYPLYSRHVAKKKLLFFYLFNVETVTAYAPSHAVTCPCLMLVCVSLSSLKVIAVLVAGNSSDEGKKFPFTCVCVCVCVCARACVRAFVCVGSEGSRRPFVRKLLWQCLIWSPSRRLAV